MLRLLKFVVALWGLIICWLAAPADAALLAKTWVSNTGSDGNDCSLANPCATLQRAHDQTSAGGEIGILTPGEYGDPSVDETLRISKSISITNESVGEASIKGQDDAIFIGAGLGDVVSLRGLVIDGRGGGVTGIAFQTGSALHMQNCIIRNFIQGGLFFVAGVGNSTKNQLFVSDTIIYNNNGTGIIVRNVATANGEIVLDRVHSEDNGEGLAIESFGTGGGAHVILRDSVISGNAGNGIRASTQAGHPPAFAVVERSSIVNNQRNGILADGPGATLLLNDSTLVRNGVGISTVNGGQLISYRNNRINNNLGPDGAPTGFDARD